jgi:hypothetical protein
MHAQCYTEIKNAIFVIHFILKYVYHQSSGNPAFIQIILNILIAKNINKTITLIENMIYWITY